MLLSSEHDSWGVWLHLLIMLDHWFLKVIFLAISALVAVFLFIGKRSYGEEGPTGNETERATVKVLRLFERGVVVGALIFLIIQLIRAYLN